MEKIKKILYNYWKVIALSIFLLSLLGGTIWYYFSHEKNMTDITIDESLDINEDIMLNEEEQKDTASYLYIDIKGEVNSPGIYKMESGTRVIDAINTANGLTKDANTKVNNLSMKLFDEMVIIIYSNEEVKNFTKTQETTTIINNACINESTIKNDACLSNETNASRKININSSSKEELVSLPGIGEAKATAIIDYRLKNGPFNDIAEVLDIEGISNSIYEKIKDSITI